MSEDKKSFEQALFAAFKAGVEVGTGYESVDALPIGYRNLRWRAFRDAWGGEPWSQERWEDELRQWHDATPRGWGLPDNPEDLIGTEVTVTKHPPVTISEKQIGGFRQRGSEGGCYG